MISGMDLVGCSAIRNLYSKGIGSITRQLIRKREPSKPSFRKGKASFSWIKTTIGCKDRKAISVD